MNLRSLEETSAPGGKKRNLSASGDFLDERAGNEHGDPPLGVQRDWVLEQFGEDQVHVAGSRPEIEASH